MFRPFNPRGAIEFGRGNLPHWRQAGRTYFVTFRLGDSLPEVRLRPWRLERDAWLAAHPRPWPEDLEAEYEGRFSKRIQKWLDAGAGCCLLRSARPRGLMEDTLRFGHPNRYGLDAFVVAANHVHVIVEPVGSAELPKIMHSWKSFSAHRIGRGPIWQKESYDRIIRNEFELDRFRTYIGEHEPGAKRRDAASTDAFALRGARGQHRCFDSVSRETAR